MAFPLYNGRFMLLISASFITIFSSIAIYFCLPILISHIIRTQLSLSPTSGSFNDWRLNSVVDRIYLYNITNLEDILNEASSKHSVSSQSRSRPIPKIEQVGPFTYRQEREKINIKFDTTNETVVYDQVKRWIFIPELSQVKTIQDLNSTWINHLNVPLVGTTLNAEYVEFIEPLIAEFDLKLFNNHSANTLLFEGYHDVLMEQAKAQNQIDVDRFGWLHNQNNSITRAIRVFTGPSNATLDKLGAVDQSNNMNQFTTWHNNGTEPIDTKNVQCNEFRLSSAGEFFPPPEYSIISHNNHLVANTNKQEQSDNPPDLIEQQLKKLVSSATNHSLLKFDSANITTDEISSSSIHHKLFGTTTTAATNNKKSGKTISLFMPDLCRTFKLFYNGTYIYKELSVDRYIANEFTYDYSETGSSVENSELSQQNKLAGSGGGGVELGSGQNSNKCYCTYNETTKLTSCPPNGMMDLFNCRKGSPLTISFPHFLYSNQDKSLEPYLRLFDDPIQPNENEHQFFMDLESTLNIPVRAQIVIQFNVHYRNEQSFNFTRDYSFLLDNPQQNGSTTKPLTDLYLPQMWFKSTAEVDDRNLNNLKFIQQHLSLVTPIATLILFALGSILLMMSAKLAYDLYYGPKSRKSITGDQDSCASINRNDSSFINDKQKYYSLQLLDGEKSDNHQNGGAMIDANLRICKPTTSKMDDFGSGESQPLNS